MKTWSNNVYKKRKAQKCNKKIVYDDLKKTRFIE